MHPFLRSNVIHQVMNEKWKVRNFSLGYLAKRNFEKQLVAGLDAYPN